MSLIVRAFNWIIIFIDFLNYIFRILFLFALYFRFSFRTILITIYNFHILFSPIVYDIFIISVFLWFELILKFDTCLFEFLTVWLQFCHWNLFLKEKECTLRELQKQSRIPFRFIYFMSVAVAYSTLAFVKDSIL